MTDRELIRWAAETVMGWRLLPPSGIIDQHFWEDKHEQFKFWAESGIKEERIFDPINDSNHLMLVVEKMVSDGKYGLELIKHEDITFASFFGYLKTGEAYLNHDGAEDILTSRAVLLAAKAALEGE